MDDLPKADQSLVAQTVPVSLSVGGRNFYYYDKKNHVERLVVLEEIAADPAPEIASLVIYETSFGGVEGFLKLLQQSAPAKVLAVVNVSYEEFNYTGMALPFNDSSYSFTETEILDPEGEIPQNENAIEFYSFFLSEEDVEKEGAVFLCGNVGNESSERLNALIQVLENLYERFSLDDRIGLN